MNGKQNCLEIAREIENLQLEMDSLLYISKIKRLTAPENPEEIVDLLEDAYKVTTQQL